MLERLLIAGAGGQGLLFVGKLLAETAIRTIENVTFFPAYGAEVRGGTSNCQVILSSEMIPSPQVERFDSMLIMNQASMNRFHDKGTGHPVIIVNTSMSEVPAGIEAITIKASDMADDLGNLRVANMIMFGAYIATRKTVPLENIEDQLKHSIGTKNPELAEINIRALNLGVDSAKE